MPDESGTVEHGGACRTVGDLNGYAASYLVGGAIQALAIPFILLARCEQAHSDQIFVEPPGDEGR